MRESWNLLDEQIVSPPALDVEHVLAEYDGPELITLTGIGQRYLGVASDNDRSFRRWVYAPITNTEFKALIDGAETVRDALLKANIYVVDVSIDDVPTRAWQCDGRHLTDDNLPERGALLPRLTREHFAESPASGALPPNPGRPSRFEAAARPARPFWGSGS